MAYEQYFVQEWESISKPAAVAAATESETIRACFDCSICLDFARDPVVTLCGHLYCWPCIYKWFDSQSSSLTKGQLPQCPVCKAEISEKTMVPLYGRGESLPESEPEDKVIPPRPSACGIKGLTNLLNPDQQLVSRQNPRSSAQNSLFNRRGTEAMSIDSPTVGMYGEMVYARVFGNSESLFTYPNSYHTVGSSSPRLRRRHLEADKSLNRVTIFLFCCLLLCLLVF